jgi:tetratricopeptide (TPR) repeat protein
MELYDRALEVRQKTVEDDNPSVADTYHSIGMVLKQQGKFDEAMEILPEVAEADEGDEGQSRRGKLCRCQGYTRTWHWCFRKKEVWRIGCLVPTITRDLQEDYWRGALIYGKDISELG